MKTLKANQFYQRNPATPAVNRAGPAARSPFVRTTMFILKVSAVTAAGILLGACTSSTPKSALETPTVEATNSLSSDPSSAAETSTPLAIDSGSDAASPAPPTSRKTDGVVLPVPSNPIINTATAQTLKIDSVLVENNVDASGKASSDHLEIALSNAGTTALGDIEIFYTFTDPTTAGAIEQYYAKLPADFTIPAGGRRIVHFDDSGEVDHFPVNKFSLYYTGTHALDVSVTVSARGGAIQKFDLKKDAGGAEAAD